MSETTNTTRAIVSPPYSGRLQQVGSTGSEVARVQSYLNSLATVHPTIHTQKVDGKFGAAAKQAVEDYQRVAGLTADGKVGQATWNALVGEHSARYGSDADTYPGIVLRPGEHSQDVGHMQRALNTLAQVYTGINSQTADERYGNNMSAAARRFQQQFGLAADGQVGPKTWASVVQVRKEIQAGRRPHVVTPYSGTIMRRGSNGDYVRFLQSYLNGVNHNRVLNVDGKFGAATEEAVKQFQAARQLKADGKVGPATWGLLVPAYNNALT